MKVLLATGNAHKRREIAAIIAALGLPLELVDPGVPLPDVIEDGDTLEVRGIEEKPVVVRLVRDFIPWALVRYEQGEMMPAPARLDTVVLTPRLDRAFFVWRATFPSAPEIRLVPRRS